MNRFKEMNKAHECDMPGEFLKLSPDRQEVLCEWIRKSFIRRKTPNYRRTSYALKHYFENSPAGFYINNGTFKGAMEACGFVSYDKYGKNCSYCISEKSPVFVAEL